ncbi:RAxF-45 family protein [Paenibacillus taiwanensis]|uniref:RAxF-45 family protein n=1 Tax=Paenibacillus taiwanensis TaxID=401638 RepID=UPI0012F831A6|nr:RAxF-45 family protein [Paenibacillus taiwanensis]
MQLHVWSTLLSELRSQLLGIFHDSSKNGIRLSIFRNSNQISHYSNMTILSLP